MVFLISSEILLGLGCSETHLRLPFHFFRVYPRVLTYCILGLLICLEKATYSFDASNGEDLDSENNCEFVFVNKVVLCMLARTKERFLCCIFLICSKQKLMSA